MNFIEIIRSILLNLQANKFRVFLTSLGIIIGTFTIIMVVGIGKGSEKAVNDQFKKLSVETLMIRKNRDYRGSKQLKKEDLLKMKELPHVKDMAMTIGGQSAISYGTLTQNASISGVSQSYQSMINLELDSGQFLTDKDGEKRNKYVILGNALATTLFQTDLKAAIGKQVTIKARKYEVRGILKRVGDSNTGGFGGGGIDDSAYVPFDVAQKYIAGKRSEPNITGLAKDIKSVALATDEINEYITGVIGESTAYTVADAGSRLQSAQQTAQTMSSLLISVAIIVLIVGGIGIMNVLLVSVKERTREIGILKSIGAKRRDILLEFLLEAIVISVMGGIIGVLLSLAMFPLMGYVSLVVISSVQGLLLGLGFAVVTGTFFGYYPAMKASKLKPIDALNYE